MNSTSGSTRVYVDADSCPVKKEIVEIARNFEVEVHFVASYNHHLTNHSFPGHWHYVDSAKEATDLFLMNHVKDYDVVVTQDIGLTAALLGKKATVLHPRGFILDNNQIESALHMRYLSAKERRQGNYGKGPKAFTKEDKKRFKKKLNEILSKIKGNL